MHREMYTYKINLSSFCVTAFDNVQNKSRLIHYEASCTLCEHTYPRLKTSYLEAARRIGNNEGNEQKT
jgi:hypothetical protein